MKRGMLLGAGFSYDLGMPLTHELTEVFLGMFTKDKAKRFAEQVSQHKPYTENRPINRKAIFEGIELLIKYKESGGKNYEEFLSSLQGLSNHANKSQSDKDSYNHLFYIFYEIIHYILTLYQTESFSRIYNQNLKWFSGLSNLLSEEETWVFTLNHDLYMECLAIDLQIPITYGDIYKISFPISNVEMENKIHFTCLNRSTLTLENSGFFSKSFGINLVKLHGGLSELEYKDRNIICNLSLLKSSSSDLIKEFKKIDKMAYYTKGQRAPGGKERTITNSKGELDIICQSMLTGGRKYSTTTNPKEGEEKLKILTEVLNKLDELLIIGYGFGDSHINDRISNAMVLNKNLKVRVIDPFYSHPPTVLRQFNYDDRVQGALCHVSHWMDYSVSKKWNKEQMDSLEKNKKYRTEIKEKIISIVGQ